jgi:gamma-glutamyltranspeptidase/glutathione hydrolase
MKGMVAAGHELTASAGVEILKHGGNAFDAALAACFASFVSESSLTSPAGGGFMMTRTSAGDVRLYDFFTDVPGKGREAFDGEIDFFSVDILFGSAYQELHIGTASAAVPGVVAGLDTVHGNHCTMPIEDILAPAIKYAGEGIRLNARQAYFNSILSPMLTISDESRGVYAPGGHLLKEGDVIRNKGMAQTLEYLAKEGLGRFYDGEVAGKIIEGFGGRMGLITEEDLSGYRVCVREPLGFPYRGRTVFTNPPPSSGGSLIAFALRILEGFDLKGLEHNSAEYLKLLSLAMRVTNEARRKEFDSRVYEEGAADEFLSPENVELYRKRLKERIGSGLFGDPDSPAAPGHGNTTQISVVDKDGNAASITTSTGIGCGFMIPGTGMMMNNMLGEEDLNPRGFHSQPPGVRMSSMMAPTIVVRDGSPEIVLGSGGSKRIRSAILQVILNIVEHGMKVEEAVNVPRAHFDDGVFHVEKGVAPEALDELEAFGIALKRWEMKDMFFGGVHTVVAGPEGLAGAGDTRRGGVALGCG